MESDGIPFREALKESYKDSVTKERYFTTPLALASVNKRPLAFNDNDFQQRSAKTAKNKGDKGGKGGNKGDKGGKGGGKAREREKERRANPSTTTAMPTTTLGKGAAIRTVHSITFA